MYYLTNRVKNKYNLLSNVAILNQKSAVIKIQTQNVPNSSIKL